MYGGGGGNPSRTGTAGAGTPTGSAQPVPTAPTAAATIYNECVDPTAMSLPSGCSKRAVYTMLNDGKTTGETIAEDLIDGPSDFEGQNAIQTMSTTTT